MKIYLNSLKESWVVDRLKDEWLEYNKNLTTNSIKECDIVWIIAPWTWRKIPKRHLRSKKVVCSIYHIDEKKFGVKEKSEFYKRDKYVDEYHVISNITKSQLLKITNKKVTSIPFWVNQNIWFNIENENLRKKYEFKKEAFLIGSFQRDTEGSDLMSPKLSKGPDQLLEIVTEMIKDKKNIEVVLTGKRRNYLINNFKELGIPFHYFEMVDFDVINDLYNCLDLYIVSSRFEGGPQSVIECGITKTPIISTRVGVAEEILAKESLFDMSNFKIAKPDIDYAFNKSVQYTIPQGFKEFQNLFSRLNEN